MSLSNYFMFRLTLKVVETGVECELAKTCDDEVVLNIGGFTSLVFCNAEEFDFCCSKKATEIVVGDVIKLDRVECVVLNKDTETYDENIRFWEQVELDEMINGF